MALKKEKQQKKQLMTSRLYDIFVGQQVNLFVKNISMSNGEGQAASVIIAGYLLDECEDFFYIGSSPLEVYAAIRKLDVASVTLSDVEEQHNSAELQ